MTRNGFERLVERALSSIPEQFVREVRNLVFTVEDWADAEVLSDLEMEDPRDLLGLYLGVPLGERNGESFMLPDSIVIYQGAVENHCAETAEPMLRVIRQTLVHELAHYFGFSEEEMDAFERLWEQCEDGGAQHP